jgi:hypothetical protein
MDSNSLLQIDVDSGSLLSSLSPDEPEVDFFSWMAWDRSTRSLLLSNAAERDRAVQRVSPDTGATLQLFSLPLRLDDYRVSAMQADDDGRMWLLLESAEGNPRQLLVLDRAGRTVRQQQLPALGDFIPPMFVLSAAHDRLFVSCKTASSSSAIYIAAFSLSGRDVFNLTGFSWQELQQMAVRPDGALVLTARESAAHGTVGQLLFYNASTGLRMGNVSFTAGLEPLAVAFGRSGNEVFLSVLNRSSESSGRTALSSSIQHHRDGQLVAVYGGFRGSSPLLEQLTISDHEHERLFAVDIASYSIYSWNTQRQGDSQTGDAVQPPSTTQRLSRPTWTLQR